MNIKRVFCVHTAMALVGPLTEIFKKYLPEVKLNHIADDSLIQEVIANDGVTPAVRRRLLSYYTAAADGGADVVFNTCSSVGDIADMGNTIAPIPVFRIDYPMAAKAVAEADRIGVISTLPTTLAPTRRLLERAVWRWRDPRPAHRRSSRPNSRRGRPVRARPGFDGPHGRASLRHHGQARPVESRSRSERLA